MKCIFCQNNIITTGDDFKHTIYNKYSGYSQVSRTNYSCLSCQNLVVTVDLPDEELYEFSIYIGDDYTIRGNRDDVISIVMNETKETITMPWVSCHKFDDIMKWLQDLSVKYEMYLTFS